MRPTTNITMATEWIGVLTAIVGTVILRLLVARGCSISEVRDYSHLTTMVERGPASRASTPIAESVPFRLARDPAKSHVVSFAQ
jgi:hypothetical protein